MNLVECVVTHIEKLWLEDLFRFQNEVHETRSFKSACSVFWPTLSSKLMQVLAQKMDSILVENCVSCDEKDLGNPDILVFYGIDFSHRTLENYDFDGRILLNVSFQNSTLVNCRFRNACLYCCDMRYADINGGTFEKSDIWWCDLYRAYFQGVIRFANATISDTSINNAYFSGAALIRKMNFERKSLLQQNAGTYKAFLLLWDALRSYADKIKTDDRSSGEEKINQIINRRYEELELIFKNLSSTFGAVGFSNDSNWAYVQGKRAERKVLESKISVGDMFGRSACSQLKIVGKLCLNWLFDKAFGYGESLIKISRTYLFIVLLFTFIYMYKCNIQDILQAFIISFKNMVGNSDELPLKENIFLSLLNVLQTTLGVLITGIFGFILGNKIRNQ